MGVQTTVTGAPQTHGATGQGCKSSHTVKAIAVIPAWALVPWLHFGAVLFREQAWHRHSWDRMQRREGLTQLRTWGRGDNHAHVPFQAPCSRGLAVPRRHLHRLQEGEM